MTFCRPNPAFPPSGISCGLIPAQRSSEGWISVPSKPSVARMVMTTSLRWGKTHKEGRDGRHWINKSHNQTVVSLPYYCVLCWKTFTMLTSACGSFIRILIRSLNLKFSMSGLIYTAGALDCLAGNKLIEPNLNTQLTSADISSVRLFTMARLSQYVFVSATISPLVFHTCFFPVHLQHIGFML